MLTIFSGGFFQNMKVLFIHFMPQQIGQGDIYNYRVNRILVGWSEERDAVLSIFDLFNSFLPVYYLICMFNTHKRLGCRCLSNGELQYLSNI